MALYIPHSIFHLARLLYVRPENFGPYYVHEKHVVATWNVGRIWTMLPWPSFEILSQYLPQEFEL